MSVDRRSVGPRAAFAPSSIPESACDRLLLALVNCAGVQGVASICDGHGDEVMLEVLFDSQHATKTAQMPQTFEGKRVIGRSVGGPLRLAVRTGTPPNL